jgi:hypothetical protein
MKRIGVMEYHYHWDYFRDLIDMLSSDETNIIAFADKGEIQTSKFIKSIDTSSLDLLFVNTIQGTMKDVIHWFRFKPKCKCILTLHNVNSTLNKPTIDIKRPLRTLDTIMTYLAMKYVVLPKFDAVVALTQNVKDYIINNGLYDKPIFVIPFKYHEKIYTNTSAGFVVPGQIEAHRRDYDALLENINIKHQWVLLGKPVGKYGKRIIEKVKKLVDGYNYKITYFTERVPDDVYADYLQRAEALVNPTVKESHGYGTTKEIYGQTKTIGVYWDAIKYGKKYIEGPPWKEIPIKYSDFSLENMKKYCKEEIIDRKW